MSDPIVSKQEILQPVSGGTGDRILTPIKPEYVSPPPPPPVNYVNAFSPQSDVVSVQTGNASVQEFESVSAARSTVPEIIRAKSPLGDVVALAVLGIAVYFLTRGKNHGSF